MKHLTWIILGTCLTFSTACSDDGPDPDPDVDAMPMVDGPPATYSHANDIQPIWDANCVACHGFLTSPAYENIVDTVSPQHGTMNRITAGDTANSYIWLKITNAHDVPNTNPMPPPPAELLDQATLDMIETWITEGAAP